MAESRPAGEDRNRAMSEEDESAENDPDLARALGTAGDAAAWAAQSQDHTSALDAVLDDIAQDLVGSRNTADDVDQIFGDDSFGL